MTQENLLARYSVLHELGRGTTGAVYAARDRTTGAVVALKRLNPELKHARAARQLKHRNIVEVLDAGETAGTAYVAMEMLEGESLRKIVDQEPIPIARAIRIAHDIASGLAHAHLEGAVHGALKASSVIVLRSGVAKITDFGIGQPMSPEQARGDPADHRCDIFALGALFYEMLTQRPPVEGSPPPPSELNPHVPRALDAIVLSMLAAQPADRMPGVPILLRELQRLEEGLGLDSGAKAGPDAATASVPPPAEEPHDRIRIPDEDFDYRRAMMERESRRERSSGSPKAIFSVLALALAVLGVGYAGFMYYSPGSSEKGIAARRVQEALTASGPAAPAPVTEASKEPVAAFGPWQASPPRFADDRQAEQKSSVVGVPRPIAPPPVAEPIKAEPESSGTLFGLKMPAKPVAAEPDPLPQTESLVPRAAVPEQQPRGTAQLILAVSPGGELYINGEHHGTTPPVTTFDLEPGMHRIEVRSGSRTPYVTYMTVEPGDVRRIRHDFGAKPSRPPG